MTIADFFHLRLTGSEPGFARQEMARQYDILWRERWQRIGLSCAAYALCMIYLPVWICVLCATVNVLAELAGMRIMRNLDPVTDRAEHWAVLSTVFAVEVAYCLPAGMIWQLTDPYAKAFAMGMVMVALIHLTTVRAIDLTQGFAGFAGLALTIAVSNAAYWIGIGDATGLLLSSTCALAGLAYAVIAMISNHQLHRATASGGAVAQQADAAKSRFLAQMSHELRTPLNAILGIGQTEMRRTEDARTRDRLGVLVRAAEGLSVVLDDLLDMAAIESGKLSIVQSDGAPQDVIAATLNLFALKAEEQGLSLTLQSSPALRARARFDNQRLRQCLSNLISNGLKYTTTGGVRVQADLRPGPTPGASGTLRILVSDTGPGIPPGAEARIFEPFMRAGGQVAGTGLGLAISRALAHGMGGDLRLLPALPGQSGARFELTVALDPPRDAAPAPAAPPDLLWLDGLSVMVVDDLPTNRLVAAAYLENLGARVLLAEGGAEALTLLEDTCADIILLDMNMPPPDGLETFRRLRASEGRGRTVPIIAMTANALESDRAAYRAAGLNGYLGKPISESMLVACLHAALGARPPRQPATGHAAPRKDAQ